MNDFEMIDKMKKARFRKNNARVLRGINLFRKDYINLKELKTGLSSDITESEYLDCLNYLYEIKYIKLRNARTGEPAELADTDLSVLMGKLSADGIRFCNGRITDVCIEEL